MANREWYTVEAPNGRVLDDELTLDQAYNCADSAACTIDGAVTVVRYSRTEVRTYQRSVTVTATDLP